MLEGFIIQSYAPDRLVIGTGSAREHIWPDLAPQDGTKRQRGGAYSRWMGGRQSEGVPHVVPAYLRPTQRHAAKPDSQNWNSLRTCSKAWMR